MEANEEFRQESLADKDTVIRYLETVRRGLEEGKIQLDLKPGSIEFSPDGLILMEIKAKRKERKMRISLKLSWDDLRN